MAVNVAEPSEENRAFALSDWQGSPAFGTAVALVSMEEVGARRSSFDSFFGGPCVAAFAGAFVGCLTTLSLGAVGVPPAIASALAATLLCGQLLMTGTAALLPGEFFTAIFGGTFAGMTPVLWLVDAVADRSIVPTTVLFVALSISCGLAFSAVAMVERRSARRLAQGCGGRSGAIATAASLLFVALAPLLGADNQLFRNARAGLSEIDLTSAVIPTFAACALGMFATMLALRRPSMAAACPADRTFLAAAVAVISLVILHLSNPDDTRQLEAFYAGCFLGMSTPERLRGRVQPLLGAVILTAMLPVARALLPGIGGGLGLAAFVTVVMVGSLARLANSEADHFSCDGQASLVGTAAATRHELVPVVLPAMPRALLSRMSGRGLRAVATSFVALLAFGCLALPGQIAPTDPASEMAVSGPTIEPRSDAAKADAIPSVTSAATADPADGASTEIEAAPVFGTMTSASAREIGEAAAEASAPETVVPGSSQGQLARPEIAARPQPLKRSRSRPAQLARLLPVGAAPPLRRPVRSASSAGLAQATAPATTSHPLARRRAARTASAAAAPNESLP